MFQQVLVVGLGLIGGSIALCLRENKIARRVFGFDPEAAQEVIELNLVDEVCFDLAAACASSDLVVLATPPTQFDAVIGICSAHLKPGALLIDVGSTKQPFISLLSQQTPSFAARCVPCHPIAGSEQSGPSAAKAQLFKGARVIVTPHETSSPDAVQMAELLWAAMGAQTMQMTASLHDIIFAQVSHLPHIVAFALAGTLAAQPNAMQLLEQGGAGMRDTSRIAGSNPALWADIALSNRSALLKAIDDFDAQLQMLRAALEQGQRGQLESLMKQASDWRRKL
jgi:prephenate dehydrogenase